MFYLAFLFDLYAGSYARKIIVNEWRVFKPITVGKIIVLILCLILSVDYNRLLTYPISPASSEKESDQEQHQREGHVGGF